MRHWLATLKSCIVIALAYFQARQIGGQMFCGWVIVHIFLSVACRVPSHTKTTRTRSEGSVEEPDELLHGQWFVWMAFLGNAHLPTPSVCRGYFFVLASFWVVWGFLGNPFGQQFKWIQPSPSTESLVCLPEMANWDFLPPILRIPYQDHHHLIWEVSAALGFCTILQMQPTILVMSPSPLFIRLVSTGDP